MLSGSTPEERKVESKIGKSSRYAGPTRASVGPAKLSCSLMALQSYPKLGRKSLYAPDLLVIGCRAALKGQVIWRETVFLKSQQSPKKADSPGLTPPNTPGSWGNRPFLSERTLTCCMAVSIAETMELIVWFPNSKENHTAASPKPQHIVWFKSSQPSFFRPVLRPWQKQKS